jgi:hypothetical protein
MHADEASGGGQRPRYLDGTKDAACVLRGTEVEGHPVDYLRALLRT